MIRVLLVEDDENIARIIRGYLAREGGYDVCWAPDSERALDTACGGQDIILLDVMLPGMNGIELCRKLRQWYQCPILFISCLNDSGTIVQALESGGDDYLVKPFDNVILHAKIQATLRRVHMDRAVVPQTCSFRHFSFHAERQEIVKDSKPIRLLAMESHLLAYLIQHTGECFPASELYKAVWGGKAWGDSRTVSVHICTLRRKIENDPKNPVYIRSVWGKGYCFVADEAPAAPSP